jgi:hypothetical protein
VKNKMRDVEESGYDLKYGTIPDSIVAGLWTKTNSTEQSPS